MIITIYTLVACGVSSSSEVSQLTEKEKVEDFEYLYKTIEENYPFLEVNKRVNGVDWLGNKEEYLESIKSSNGDYQFIQTLDNILKDLNNDHT